MAIGAHILGGWLDAETVVVGAGLCERGVFLHSVASAGDGQQWHAQDGEFIGGQQVADKEIAFMPHSFA